MDIGTKNHIYALLFLTNFKLSLTATLLKEIKYIIAPPNIVTIKAKNLLKNERQGSYKGLSRSQLITLPPVIAPILKNNIGEVLLEDESSIY